MITDVFFRRYVDEIVKEREPPAPFILFFRQIAHVILRDISSAVQDGGLVLQATHDALARELGTGALETGASIEEVCLNFLVRPFERRSHGIADEWVKLRLSFVELFFRELEPLLRAAEVLAQPVRGPIMPMSGPRKPWIWSRDAPQVQAAIEELNQRLRTNALGFHYHNGYLQRSGDAAIEGEVEGPFWKAVSGPKWQNVDLDMKEALDRRDGGKSDGPFYALKALESTLKIICDARGWTTGSERGAHAFVDHLASKKNNFIAGWERDILKSLFTNVRNPQGHGAGAGSPTVFSSPVEDAIIGMAMTWIRSLKRRL